jgi:hypothetical protein
MVIDLEKGFDDWKRKGYEEGNVQWVHKRINIMRNILSVHDLIDLCRKIVDHANKN